MAPRPSPQVLFHYRWAMPVLAELQRTDGSKFISLVRHLQISRDSLRRTLLALIRLRLVRRNPGYGHPLRPEYILTASGRRVAPWAVRFLDQVQREAVGEPVMNKWSMPVMLALRRRPAGFSALKRTLPGVTGRALALALKDLHAAGLLRRAVIDSHPPSTSYALTEKGARLVRAFAE